jgi:hypothetical protein
MAVLKRLVTIVGRSETMADAKQEKTEAFREAAKDWLEKMKAMIKACQKQMRVEIKTGLEEIKDAVGARLEKMKANRKKWRPTGRFGNQPRKDRDRSRT